MAEVEELLIELPEHIIQIGEGCGGAIETQAVGIVQIRIEFIATNEQTRRGIEAEPPELVRCTCVAEESRREHPCPAGTIFLQTVQAGIYSSKKVIAIVGGGLRIDRLVEEDGSGIDRSGVFLRIGQMHQRDPRQQQNIFKKRAYNPAINSFRIKVIFGSASLATAMTSSTVTGWISSAG